jgi:hypothetical protein
VDRAVHEHFKLGTQTAVLGYVVVAGCEVLVSATTTLLINKRPTATSVHVNGQVITLARHEVRVLR